MENKGIIDFIERLQSAMTKKDGEKSANEQADKTEQSDINTAIKTTAAGTSFTRNGNFIRKKEQNENSFTSDEKSYIKAYNPFSEALANKPQIAAPRAKKQPKEKIDLSAAKNLASEKRTEASKNMLELINRHNKLMSELKNR